MAITRRERKSRHRGLLAAVALAVTLAAAATQPPAVWGATAERVVLDWHTGRALYGFDPVAYFTDAAPSLGRPEFEYAFAGAIWQFRNEGNRTAFMSRPDVYMPSFGGYDPIGLARNLAIPGNPQFWMIVDQRLYLFHDIQDRAAFAADPAKFVPAAQRIWPAVSKALLP